MRLIWIDEDDIHYDPLLEPENTDELQSLLRRGSCFVPSFVDADPYLIETYIVQFARYATNTTFLIDRNIYSHFQEYRGRLVSALENELLRSEPMRL